MNIIESCHIFAEDIRTLCIKKKWYTHGTREEYAKMLKDYDNVTAADIYDIALDIHSHSGSNHTIRDIMSELGLITFCIYKSIPEKAEAAAPASPLTSKQQQRVLALFKDDIEAPRPKSLTLREWADATEHDDRAALEDILEGESYKDLRYYGPEICDMLLKYHGHGMSTSRLKHLADTYLR